MKGVHEQPCSVPSTRWRGGEGAVWCCPRCGQLWVLVWHYCYDYSNLEWTKIEEIQK